MSSRGLGSAIVTLLAVALMVPAGASAAVGREFFGVVPQALPSVADFQRMHGVVGTVRVPIEWSRVEPQPGDYDLSGFDEVVGRAADEGIRVLPFVYGSPDWLTGNPARPPLGPRGVSAWASLLRHLVRRYEAGGAFWAGREREVPIRSWQIWNEPNYLLFWRPRPAPRAYGRLLMQSARVIRAVDPDAQILSAGVAPVEAGITPWAFLRRMYRVRGVARSFDVLALHPYAPYVPWVEKEIRFVRAVMVEAGDGAKPMQLTEVGVASDGEFRNPYDKGPDGQAGFLAKALKLALANRKRWHLVGVDWFTWQDSTAADPHCVFCQYGGLFDASGKAKAAWSVFRHVAGRVG
jgi:polysaccharide biosynthesis protein PslG